jgi:hypothetical protein
VVVNAVVIGVVAVEVGVVVVPVDEVGMDAEVVVCWAVLDAEVEVAGVDGLVAK